MKEPKPNPVFVDRAAYRRRRMADAARILPLFGFVLVAIPLLWARETVTSTGNVMIYVFVVWGGLIGISALISRQLRPPRGAAMASTDKRS